jgi:hypothetical protein
MSRAKLTDKFKRDAVAQVEDRGYPVSEVAAAPYKLYASNYGFLVEIAPTGQVGVTFSPTAFCAAIVAFFAPQIEDQKFALCEGFKEPLRQFSANTRLASAAKWCKLVPIV